MNEPFGSNGIFSGGMDLRGLSDSGVSSWEDWLIFIYREADPLSGIESNDSVVASPEGYLCRANLGWWTVIYVSLKFAGSSWQDLIRGNEV